MFESLLRLLPHWVDSISREEKHLKLIVTQRYGYIALVGSLVLTALIPLWRRFAQRFGIKMETRTNIVCIITLWSLFTLFVSTAETRSDLLVVAKRTGRVSAALMPALLLLTLRPSPLPETLYLTVLPIHKWLSRIVVFKGVIHTVLYILYFRHKNTVSKLWKLANIYGIIAMFAFSLIAITSLPRVRRVAFKTFYITHYIMTWTSVIALHFHARPGIPVITTLNVLILSWQICYRLYHTTRVKFTVSTVSPTLALVEFPTDAINREMILPMGHIRINNVHRSLLKALWYNVIPLQHPYTISSLPKDKVAKLIVRRGEFPLESNKDYYVTGSFEPEIGFLHSPKQHNSQIRQPLLGGMSGSPLYYNISAERVLIIVGGSGISFGLPLYRLLNYNGISVRLIWVCKDMRDLNVLNWYRGIQGIECYVTGENDVEVDYYDDVKHGIDSAQTVEYYGSVDDDASEIDFTTMGREYKEAHHISDPPSLSSMPSRLSLVPLSPQTPRVPPVVQLESTPLPALKKFKHLQKRPPAKSVPVLPRESNVLSKPSTKSLNFHEDVKIATSGQCSYFATPPHLQHLPRSSVPEFDKMKLPASVRIFSGRPDLGADDYAWCTQTSCIGPRVVEDRNVCCRDAPDSDEHKHVNKRNVWVVGAGPQALVDQAGDWAKEGGLRWHGEAFSV